MSSHHLIRAAGTFAAALVLAACSAGGGLSGTTWKGGNLFDSNIVFTFTDATHCTVKSIMANGPCTYEVSGNQALVTIKGTKYAFAFQDSQMQGNLMGAGVQLVKQ